MTDKHTTDVPNKWPDDELTAFLRDVSGPAHEVGTRITAAQRTDNAIAIEHIGYTTPDEIIEAAAEHGLSAVDTQHPHGSESAVVVFE